MTDSLKENIISGMRMEFYNKSIRENNRKPICGVHIKFTQIDEDWVLNNWKQFDSTLTSKDIRNLFEELEQNGEGTVNRSGNSWSFKFK